MVSFKVIDGKNVVNLGLPLMLTNLILKGSTSLKKKKYEEPFYYLVNSVLVNLFTWHHQEKSFQVIWCNLVKDNFYVEFVVQPR